MLRKTALLPSGEKVGAVLAPWKCGTVYSTGFGGLLSVKVDKEI